jgi:acetyltransferase-like isoleucine patch superfamily enzyme
MKPQRLYICMLIFRVLPETRLFKFKSSLLRWAGAEIGENVRCCSSVTILGSGDLSISDDTWVGHQVLICAGSRVTIGRSVDIGPRAYIGTGTHEIDTTNPRAVRDGFNKDIEIENRVWLGAGCIILPGITISEDTVIAAGAVVTEGIPSQVLAAGVPATIVRRI